MAIGQTVHSLSMELKKQLSGCAMEKIISLRNYIAHNYEGLNPKEIWKIIQFNLPELKQHLNKILLKNN